MPLLLARWYRAYCNCGNEYWVKSTTPPENRDVHCHVCHDSTVQLQDFASALSDPDKVPDEFMAETMVTIANALVDIRNKILT